MADILQGIAVMAGLMVFLLAATYSTRHVSRAWTGFAIGLVFTVYFMFVRDRIPAVQKGEGHVLLFLAGQFCAVIVGWVVALSVVQRRRYRRFLEQLSSWQQP